jgi:phosphoketolase
MDALFAANPTLRARVGNPDELSSNRMAKVLARLKHRVTDPEPGNHEAVNGAVITALNEEAVVCSTLANKGGINLIVSYEAFAVKMLGALRQEIIFSRHQREAGKAPGWLSVPLIVTSHVWENGKNEQSHQDPSLCENLLGEMGDVARVLFPADANSAIAALQSVYASHGIIATLVVPKQDLPVVLSGEQAETLTRQGAFVIRRAQEPAIELVAIGAYQLQQATLAWQRLQEHGIGATLICLQEPGRFREPRDTREAGSTATDSEMAALFSRQIRARIFISHTRPAVIAGILRRLDTGPHGTSLLGYQNHGGTLDTGGMLYANRCTWAHIVAESARLLGLEPQRLLAAAEWQAVAGTGDPYAVISEPHPRILPQP